MPPRFAKNHASGDGRVPKKILGRDNVLRTHLVRPENANDPDPVTQEIYAEAPIVHLDGACREIESRMFGQPLEDAAWGRLVGGIAGSTVVGLGYPGSPDVIDVTVHHHYFDQIRRNLYHVRYDGVMTLDNEALYKSAEAPYRYLGLRMVGMQILTAKVLGMHAVTTFGSGNGPAWGHSADIGYRLWPELGFDADLTDQGHPLLERALRRLQSDYSLQSENMPTTIQELLALPAGRAWWREHGVPLELEFVVDASGVGVHAVLGYLQEEGIWLG